jgi:hypothetical protein
MPILHERQRTDVLMFVAIAPFTVSSFTHTLSLVHQVTYLRGMHSCIQQTPGPPPTRLSGQYFHVTTHPTHTAVHCATHPIPQHATLSHKTTEPCQSTMLSILSPLRRPCFKRQSLQAYLKQIDYQNLFETFPANNTRTPCNLGASRSSGCMHTSCPCI